MERQNQSNCCIGLSQPKGDDLAAIRVAFDSALNEVTEKHSLEFRFGVRWAHSVRTCLHMEERHEAFRSSDIYS